MADIGTRHTSPWTQLAADDSVTSASTTPLPISFRGDSDTGLFRPAANTLAVVCGGTEAVRFTSGALVQFAAASNQANGSSGTTWSTSVRPASAGETVAGWIRIQDKDGAARFIPYF